MSNFYKTQTGISIILAYFKKEKETNSNMVLKVKELYTLNYIKKRALKRYLKHLKTIDKYLDLTITVLTKYLKDIQEL